MKTSSPLLAASSAGEQVASDSVLLTVTGALALIIFVMIALAWIARRSGLTRHLSDGKNTISIVASKSLGNRERLVVVDIQDQRLVLGITATQITRLAQLEQISRDEVTVSAAPGGDFSAVLQTIRKRYLKGPAS